MFTSESETESQVDTNPYKDSDVEVVESPIGISLPKSISKKSSEETKWMKDTISTKYIWHIPKEWN